MKRISLDTETTGLDFFHGARPFLVTVGKPDWSTDWWEWDVNPLNREVQWKTEDIEEVLHEVEEADEIVFQHGKFDVAALTPYLPKGYVFPWDKVRDTTISGHLLASNHPHDLTSMCIEYLGISIQKWEDATEKAVKYVRNLVQRASSPIKHWMIAREGLACMPSAKATLWKNDLWLPRAFAKWCEYEERLDLLPPGHNFLTVTADYANTDTPTTLALHVKHLQCLEQRGLTAIYESRLPLVRIAYKMEQRGITLNRGRLDELERRFRAISWQTGKTCRDIAKGYDGYELELPKSGTNNSLNKFVFETMKLPTVVRTKKTGNASLNKEAIEVYAVTLDAGTPELTFVQSLADKRKCDKALSDIGTYQRFWHPTGIVVDGEQLWYLVHPSLNITGTATLRWSSSNPNEQNISKKEGFNLRYCFGPLPGREWWSLDAKNIELRIPAYTSGEQDIIDLFEHPDEPPYYGSTHLLNFHTVYDDIWDKELDLLTQEFGKERTHDAYVAAYAKVGPHCKKKFAATWYQYCKNGGFAVQYGAVLPDDPDKIGTADRAFHRIGSHAKLKARFKKLEKLNQQKIAEANKYGYVQVLPDKTVDPSKGYPLLCTRTQYGKALETVPLNYWSQGTAMQWTAKGMIRCDAKLQEWETHEQFIAYMEMQVHDELVFDFPAGTGPKPWLTNLPRVKVLAGEMSKGGDDIGIPTPVGIEYHSNNWSEGVTLQ